MSAERIVGARFGLFVTARGKEAAQDPEICHCVPKLAGLLLICPLCDTVYGSLRDQGPSSASVARKPA